MPADRRTTGSAVTRRGLAGRPQRMFSQARPAAPGELMEIDSTPWTYWSCWTMASRAGWS
ncbi:MAG: hypothetical protein ABSF03_22435 [Streptosporangiaceae bacterium]